MLLAQQGLDVVARDVAEVAVASLPAVAHEREWTIQAEVRDVEARPPAPETFDVAIVSYFLNREIILRWGRPSGTEV